MAKSDVRAARIMSLLNHSPVLRYGLPAGAVFVVLVLRLAAWHGSASPFLLFVPILIFAVRYCGPGPGLLTTFLVGMIVDYFFITPYHILNIRDIGGLAEVFAWLIVGIQVTWFISALERRAAEAADGQRILRALMAYVPEGIVITEGQAGKVRMVSKYAEGLAGRSQEAMVGYPLSQEWRICSQSRNHHSADFEDDPLTRATSLGEITQGLDCRLRRPDGTAVPILCNAGPIRDETGKILGGVLTWCDISELKLTSETLRASDQRFRVALSHAGISVFTNDRDLRYTWVYNPPSDLTGERLIGKRPAEIFCPDDSALLTEAKQLVLQTGVGDRREIPLTIDGKIHFFDVVTEPTRDEDGAINGILGSAADITDRKLAEEALRQANERLELRVQGRTAELAKTNDEIDRQRRRLFSLLDALPFFVCLIGRDHSIRFSNRQFRTTFGDAENGMCYRVIANNSQPCASCPCFRIFTGESQPEWEWTSPAGRHYRISNFPFLESDGSLMVLEIGIDITERKMAEEALRHSEKQLRALSNRLLTVQETERMRISRELHDELGQGLSFIKLRMGLVGMNLREKHENLGEDFRSVLSHIDQLIENVRRLSWDLCPTTLETLGLTAALQRLANDFVRVADISVSLDMADLDRLLCLQLRIVVYRIFQEALNNVVKHAEATLVSISARHEKNRITFVIQDNGKGMDFAEVEERRINGVGGFGLAAMKERVWMLGSTLDIWSQKGSGTRLSFSVPVSEFGE